MVQQSASREMDKFVLRLPDGMRDRLKARAKATGRSLNAEMVAILAAALGLPDEARYSELRKEFGQLEEVRLELIEREREIREKQNILAEQISDIAINMLTDSASAMPRMNEQAKGWLEEAAGKSHKGGAK